jgi:hypothetical protein
MDYQSNVAVKIAMKKVRELISVIYIPYKSNLNGLLVYMLCFYIFHLKNSTKKLPFIVDFYYYLKVDNINDSNVISKIIER